MRVRGPGGIPYHPLPLALGVAGYPPYPCHRVLALLDGSSGAPAQAWREAKVALAHHVGFGQPGLRGQSFSGELTKKARRAMIQGSLYKGRRVSCCLAKWISFAARE